MKEQRRLGGLFSEPEQQIIGRIVRWIPRQVSPDHLSAVAFSGALMSAASLIGSRYSAWYLAFFYIGLFCNWFGDSFDGALARWRNIERPRIGFLIDKSSDMLSFSAIILALGLSPYCTLVAALVLLVVYLLHNVYCLMRTVIDGVHFIGLGGIGATEGRLFFAAWVGGMQFTRVDIESVKLTSGQSLLDIASGCLLVMFLLTFSRRVSADLQRLYGQSADVAHLRHESLSTNVIPLSRSAGGMASAEKRARS